MVTSLEMGGIPIALLLCLLPSPSHQIPQQLNTGLIISTSYVLGLTVSLTTTSSHTVSHNAGKCSPSTSFVYSASSLHYSSFGPSSVSLLPRLSPKIFLFLCGLLSHWRVSSPTTLSITSHSLILIGSAWLFQQSTEFFWFTSFPFSIQKWWLVPPHFADKPQVLLKVQEFSFHVPERSLAQSCPQPQSPSEAQSILSSPAGNAGKHFRMREF